MFVRYVEDTWIKLWHFECVSVGVLGDEVFDGDCWQFCSFGTEFDSPCEMYVVHVWLLLYRVCAVMVNHFSTKLTNMFKLCFKSVSICFVDCRLQLAVFSLQVTDGNLQLAVWKRILKCLACILQFA